MSKKFVAISLAIIAVLGSLWTFYASNMFFGDVSNIKAGFMKTTMFVSFPGLLLGAMIVASTLFIVRLYKRPNNKKALCKLYLIIAAVLAFLGIVFAVLGGVINYRGNFVKYPFPGYLIIMIIIHVLVLAASIFLFVKYVRKMPEDAEKFKGGVKHVFHTLGLYLLVALAFNRFGAFLLMPVYVQWSTLYMTFVYFLFLLIPMALLIIKVLGILEFKKSLLIPVIVVAALNVVLFAVTALIGLNDSAFISAVSAAAPLERLGAMPMEILIHFVSYLGVSIYYVIKEIKNRKANSSSEEAKPQE